MGLLPSWRKAPSWKGSDPNPNDKAYDSCGEKITHDPNGEDDTDEEDEVRKKERENLRRIEMERIMAERERQMVQRNREEEYDSDSEVDEDEEFDVLMRDGLPSPHSSPSTHHTQNSTGKAREEIIIISDTETETETETGDSSHSDEEMVE